MTMNRTNPERPNRALNVALWIVQVLLAAMFGMAGVMKTTMPIAELAKQLPWAGVLPEPLVRFIGASELAGALGMILPAATRILPALTGWAGVGLTVVMALAMSFHLSRGEMGGPPINLTLGVLAAFVAWGRLRKVPISPRA
jgi:uncharacterized membrane protein YphA (DoxX/SURF4 family)